MRYFLIVVLAAGCAVADVHTHFPVPAAVTDPTGTLVLILGEAADGVTIAINGVLVVEGVHTRRVVVDGVPVGTAEVIMAANGADKQFKVWVGTDHATSVPLGIPDPGIGFLKTLAGTVITVVLYSLLLH